MPEPTAAPTTKTVMSLPEALGQALELHRQGRLAEAENFYAAILRTKPDHFDALHMLGVIKGQQGNNEASAKLIREALQASPESPEAFYNLGIALANLGRHEEALASYDRALTIKPDYAEALRDRGIVLRLLNRHEEALANYDRALAIKPEHVEALNNRGNTLYALNRYEEALASYERALALKPDYADALNNRAAALQALNRYEEALASYDRALALKPDHAEALNNRGLALVALKRPDDALATFDQALSLKAEYAEALINRGAALQALKHYEQALADYDRALVIKPDNAEALRNRGIVLRVLNRPEEALGSFDRAFAIKPEYAAAVMNHLGVKVRLVCATRHNERDFFQRSALGRSLKTSCNGGPWLDLALSPENKKGLPAIYNSAIRESETRPAILVFLHDDIFLIDFFWADKIVLALNQFGIVGLAGNRRRVPKQPSWAFVDDKFTWDAVENLSGTVGHGSQFPCFIDRYGPAPSECKLLDGLFLAASSETLLANDLYFDERYDFHFYDLDFCREADRKGVKMGTFPISVIHESVGSLGGESWRSGYGRYLEKWGE